MEIDKFISLLNECKASTNCTGNNKIYCKTWDNHKTWFIKEENARWHEWKCKTCGHLTYSEQDGVYLHLKQPKECLTIFEADFMFMMFMQKKKPYDYARWHECVAGKEFIENIESIYFSGENDA